MVQRKVIVRGATNQALDELDAIDIPDLSAAYEAAGGIATHAGLADPHTGYQKESEKSAVSGYASLDAGTKVPIAELPTGTSGTTVALGDAAAGLVTTHEGAANPHPTYETAAEVLTQIGTHEGLANPHPGYLTPAEGDAAYDALGAAAAAAAASQPLDSDLTAIAALTTTAYGRALLALADAAALAAAHTHGGSNPWTAVIKTADESKNSLAVVADDVADVVLCTTGLNPWFEEDVILQAGASGGVFKLQWAQVTSNAGPTTCLEGSYLEYAVT